MYIISKVINNLKMYGNCEVFIPTNDNINSIINFTIKEGKLNVKVIKKFYNNRPYWDGEVENENASLIASNDLGEYINEDLNYLIATLITNSFYGKELLIKKDETQINDNNEESVQKIYSIVDAMLNLEAEDYANIAKNSGKGMENILLSKIPEDLKIKEVPKLVTMAMELKMKNLDATLYAYKYSWKIMQNSRTEEEYNKAEKEWQLLLTKKDK